MTWADIAAAAAFLVCWQLYGPLLRATTNGRNINTDMSYVRAAWMRRLMARENRIIDSNLLGQQLNTASFFASTNLLVIAAVSGLLFSGEQTLGNLGGLVLIAPSPLWLLEVKIGLVVVVLSMGLLDFVWAIRQFNYCLALFGAAPEAHEPERHERFVVAMTTVLDPAYASFNRGVRAYYFALAGAAWIVSPWAMSAAAVAAFTLLMHRQTRSGAATGLRDARALFEEPPR